MGVDVALHAVSPERRTPAHEGVGDTESFKIAISVEGFPESRIDELRQKECPKQCSGTAGNHL